MGKKFVKKKLKESKEIQKSYDKGEFLDAVLKCRIYLESWLWEYIIAILFPTVDEATEKNREFVIKRFEDMFYQTQWLHNCGYINKKDYDNLNKIRTFFNKTLQEGNVFKVVNLEQLDRFLETAVCYCKKYKDRTEKRSEEHTSELQSH